MFVCFFTFLLTYSLTFFNPLRSFYPAKLGGTPLKNCLEANGREGEERDKCYRELGRKVN